MEPRRGRDVIVEGRLSLQKLAGESAIFSRVIGRKGEDRVLLLKGDCPAAMGPPPWNGSNVLLD